MKRNIQAKGPLGAQYPDAIYLWEGDSPSFLYLVPNGLSDPENPHCGGRFEAVRKQNIRTVTGNDTVDGLLDRHRDYTLFSDAQDAWSHAGKNYQNEYATVFRWRQDFQNDFVARMDWTVMDARSKANHPPRAVIDGDVTNRVLFREVSSRGRISLSARGSSDPDGNGLSYRWFLYPEAGTHSGTASLDGETSDFCTLNVPSDNAGKAIHVILAVTDNGQPALTRYRRVVVKAL